MAVCAGCEGLLELRELEFASRLLLHRFVHASESESRSAAKSVWLNRRTVLRFAWSVEGCIGFTRARTARSVGDERTKNPAARPIVGLHLRPVRSYAVPSRIVWRNTNHPHFLPAIQLVNLCAVQVRHSAHDYVVVIAVT